MTRSQRFPFFSARGIWCLSGSCEERLDVLDHHCPFPSSSLLSSLPSLFLSPSPSPSFLRSCSPFLLSPFPRVVRLRRAACIAVPPVFPSFRLQLDNNRNPGKTGAPMHYLPTHPLLGLPAHDYCLEARSTLRPPPARLPRANHCRPCRDYA